MPIWGLETTNIQSMHYILKQSTQYEAVSKNVPGDWLTVLAITQHIVDRLMGEITDVEWQMYFWKQRAKAKNHGLFMMLRRGPLHFVKDIQTIFENRKMDISTATSATERVEQRQVILRHTLSSLRVALSKIYESVGSLVYIDSSGVDESVFVEKVSLETSKCAQSLVVALQELEKDISSISTLNETNAIELAKESFRQQTLQLPEVPNDLETEDTGDTGEESSTAKEHIELTTTESQKSARAYQQLQELLHITIEGNRPTTSVGCLDFYPVRSGQPPLAKYPEWVKAPSRLQRQWLLLCASSFITFQVLKFFYRHSILAGSDDLERWVLGGIKLTEGAFKEHVIAPLSGVMEELFNTYRKRQSIVSQQDLQADLSSLKRMLDDFENDIGKTPEYSKKLAASKKNRQLSMGKGMELVMLVYEQQLRNPIMNLINGQLARAMLIQVQKLKVDTEQAMLQLDQILRANELNVALIAAVPSFLIGGGILYLLARMLVPPPPDAKREALPARLATIEMIRVVGREEDQGGAELYGEFLYRMTQAYWETLRLYRFRIGGWEQSEWPNIKQDFYEIASTISPTQRFQRCNQMMQTYAIYRAA